MPCPACGYCPHCGRGGTPREFLWPTFVPYYPQQPVPFQPTSPAYPLLPYTYITC